jgi:hypothetical protein
MTPLFKKLNFKGQKEIGIFNAPSEFQHELEAIKNETSVRTSQSNYTDGGFVISFVKSKKEIEEIAAFLQKKLQGDPIIWFAYPKGTSKKYKVDINRDNGWESIQKLGFETVRAVSIDDDWSALRFRFSQFVGK